MHHRAPDGKLTPLPDLVLPQPPEMDMPAAMACTRRSATT